MYLQQLTTFAVIGVLLIYDVYSIRIYRFFEHWPISNQIFTLLFKDIFENISSKYIQISVYADRKAGKCSRFQKVYPVVILKLPGKNIDGIKMITASSLLLLLRIAWINVL